VYAIALSVAACLRARTRVDVAWVVDADGLGAFDGSDALAITPGGGRIGSLLSGAIDGQLSDLAGRQSATGRVVDIEVSIIDANAAGMHTGGRVRCVLTPASELPDGLWQHMMDREPVCLVSHRDGDVITATTLYTSDTITDADAEIATMFNRGASSALTTGDALVTVLWPITRLVVAGAGPMADALRDAAALLGWQTIIAGDVSTATGLIAGLSRWPPRSRATLATSVRSARARCKRHVPIGSPTAGSPSSTASTAPPGSTSARRHQPKSRWQSSPKHWQRGTGKLLPVS